MDALQGAEQAIAGAEAYQARQRQNMLWWLASFVGLEPWLRPPQARGVVVVRGRVSGGTTLKDSSTGFQAPAALRLERYTEMLQWVEHRNSSRDANDASEFSYSKEWLGSAPRSSALFHDNQAQLTKQNSPVASDGAALGRRTWAGVAPATVDGRRISASAKALLADTGLRAARPSLGERLDLPFPVHAAAADGSWSIRDRVQWTGEWFQSAERPSVGDIRLRYRVSAPTAGVIVGAVGESGEVGPWVAPNGESVLLGAGWRDGIDENVTTHALLDGADIGDRRLLALGRLGGLFMAAVGALVLVFGNGAPVGKASSKLDTAMGAEVDTGALVRAASKDAEAAAYKPVPIVAEVLIGLFFAECIALVVIFRHSWDVDWRVLEAASRGALDSAMAFAAETKTSWLRVSATGENQFLLTALGMPFPLLVGAMVVIMGCLIELAKASCASFGLRLSRFTVWLGMAEEPEVYASPLDNPMTMKKFREQSWQFCIHVGMSVVEFYLVENENEHGSYMGPLSVRVPWVPRTTPRIGADGQVDAPFQPSQLLVTLYAAQLAVWIYTGFVCAFVDERRKDFLVMMGHHVVTIALVGFSAVGGHLPVGLMILYVHDVSDIFVDGLKLANYLALDGARGFFIVEMSFAACLAAWAYFRLYIYPTVCIWSASFGSLVYGSNPSGADHSEDLILANFEWLTAQRNHPGTDAPAPLFTRLFDNGIFGWLPLVGLLFVLQCLHIWWFFLLVSLGIRIATASDSKENRKLSEEEYEGASDAKAAQLASKAKTE